MVRVRSVTADAAGEEGMARQEGEGGLQGLWFGEAVRRREEKAEVGVVVQNRVADSPGEGERGRRTDRGVERKGQDARTGVGGVKEGGRGAGPAAPAGAGGSQRGERHPEGLERQAKGGGEVEGEGVGDGVRVLEQLA